jgi:hypothetical protein
MTEQDVIDAAIAFHHAGRALKAVTLLRRVLGVNPANHNALRLYGVFLRQAGQAQASLSWLERAAALHPFVPVFHQDLQKSYEALGRADLASASYCRALLAEIRAGLGPEDAPPHPLGWSPERDRAVPIAPRGQRREPLILFVSERWFLLDPRRGASNTMLYGVNAREKTHPGGAVGFFLDELALRYGGGLDAGVIDRLFARAVAELDPDIVLWTPQVNALLHALDPSVEVVAELRRRHDFKLAVSLYDLADSWGAEPAWRLGAHTDLFIAMDLPQTLAEARLPGLPTLGAWAFADPDLFRDAGGARDIPISFVGQAREARAAFLAEVEAVGLPVHRLGGQRGGAPLTYDDYADTLRRSRLTINLSNSQTGGTPHVKARVFEALLSGALLLEQANPATEHWLRPMEHYVPFADAADLAAKARHYLEHPAEARAIAERGRDHVRDTLNPAAFWRAVQDRLG